MDKPFGKLISSNLFTFHVGPEKTPFIVHSEAVARQSPTLDTLINGGLVETHSRTVAWPDVDVDTFVRFCEFCFLSDYSPPSCSEDTSTDEAKADILEDTRANREDVSPEPLEALAVEAPAEEPPMEEPPMEEPLVDETMEWGFSSRKKGKKKLPKPPKPRLFFKDKEYSLPPYLAQAAEQFKPFSNVSASQDFTPVFLGHARLYVLADKYGIEPLKELVLYKLYTTLKGFTIFSKRAGDIIQLIKFTYENTPENTWAEDLRTLVTHYVASKLDDLAMNSEFHQVLDEGGDFVTDFWKLVWRRRDCIFQSPGEYEGSY
ncbi:hypothetical protein MauCBS54593_007997 [Microsporum audouinii]